MKVDKKKKSNGSGSLRVEPDVLQQVKTYCKDNGVLISFFGTEALKEKLKKELNEKSA